MGNSCSIPSVVVTLCRTLLALACAPLSCAAGAFTLLFSAPARIWVLAKEGDIKAWHAVILMALSFGLSLPIGGLVGVVFGLLTAMYGRNAPEEPFSTKPANYSRHAIPPEREVEAEKMKADNEFAFTFETTTFTDASDPARAVTTHAHVVKPKNLDSVKGVIVVQHGLHCHAGAPRTLKVALHMAKEGYIVYCPDAIGHGRSCGSWAVVESFEAIAQNLASVFGEIARRHQGKPLFLQGESMGGMLVLYSPFFMDSLALDRLDGIIAVCPALMVADDAGDPILEEFIRLWPMPMLKGLFPKFPATPGPRGNIFSSDEALNKAAQASVDADPLEYCGDTKFLTAMTFADNLLKERNRRAFIDKLETMDKPLLLMHGTDDKCVDVRCSREFYKGSKSSDKRILEFEGKSHVLLSENEETRAKFLSGMTDFADDLVQKKTEFAH
ncbi:putative phospolipase [Chloropicon primus]|uniref:Putative phospolipase n=2 Tax=Chloropicon primus TaxID=1764295 RepID=A0A5B8MIL3_9CHLO|nr:putative phospolipase [Chloropicon primus]UPQ99343.1 putative phospolipase [Chloropicon primus]|eukprot:QDZ20131.1 putative phospolipase [Chloropicon primus]